MSNLIEHAKRELKLTGVDDGIYGTLISDAVLELLEVFSNQGHSGMSASMVIDAFTKIARFKNLTPLTDDPEEWMNHGDIWQNKRNGEAFSKDGGKTYRLNSEYSRDENLEKIEAPLHTSEKSTK